MSHAMENKAQVVRRVLNPEMQHEENAKITTLFVLGGFDVNTKQIQEECEPKRRPLMSSVFRGKLIISEILYKMSQPMFMIVKFLM